MSEILTSPSGQRMLTYVAPIYYQSQVMQAIFQAIGLEIDDLQQWTAEIREQLFPQTVTWGLKYWEFVLGLPTNEATPIEVRRQNILAKLVTRTPITPSVIKGIAQSSTGKTAIVENRISPYTFRITIESDGSGVDLERLNDAINNAKPAHLTVEYGIQYKGGASIKAETTMIVQSPLVFATESFYCGTYPEQWVNFVGYQATIQTNVQVNSYTKDYRFAGTFNCGEGLI